VEAVATRPMAGEASRMSTIDPVLREALTRSCVNAKHDSVL
jgi:hypothetical protein